VSEGIIKATQQTCPLVQSPEPLHLNVSDTASPAASPPPEDEEPLASLPASSFVALLLDELLLQPAAIAKPTERQETKKIFELCIGNHSSWVTEKAGAQFSACPSRCAASP
jgi:hypothetical protein